MPVTDRPRWMHPRHPISQATDTQLQQYHDAASGIGEDNMEIGEDCEAPSVPPRTLTPTVEIDEVDRSDRPPPLPPRCPYGWALVAEEAQRMRDSRWAFFPESCSYYRTEPIEPCTVGEDLSKDDEVEDCEPQSFGDEMRGGEGRGHCENDLPDLGRENYEDWHQRREGKNEMFDVDVQENKGGDKGHTEEAATSVETGGNREEETLSGSLKNKENEKRTDTEVDGSGDFGNGSDGDKVNVTHNVGHQELTFQEPAVSTVTCAKLDAFDHRLLNTEKTQKRRAPLPPLSASLPPPLSPIVLPAQFPLGSHESSAPSTHLHPHHQSLALPHCASQDTEDLDQNVNVRRGRRHSTSGRLVTASQVINPLFEDSWEHGEEVFSFCHSVAKIRELFPHSDTETNPGWSLAQARVPAGPQGLLFRVLVDYGRKEGSVIFSTDSDSPVELLLIQLLCLLSLELPSVQQLQHYFLQPHGLQQVLQRERSVVSHDCVQRSQRVGQLPHFQLLHSTDKILAFARTAKDDETPTSLDIDWTAHGCTRRKALGRQGMSMMMDMYHSEVETLRLNQTLTPGGVDRMVQAVKAACLSMDSVETAAVTAGVRALRCLSLAGDSVNSDNFPDSFWEPVTASHQPPLEALTSALHDICDLFRQTFRTEPITSLEAPCGVQNMTVEQSLGIAGNNGDEEVRTDNECESHRHERTVGETESEEMVGTMDGDETVEVEIIFGGEIVEPTKGCDNDRFLMCSEKPCIFSSSLTTDVLEITLYALHKLPSAWLSNYENYHMECRVWHGSKELGKAWKSQQVTPSHHFFQLVLWNEQRTFPLSLSQLPRESRLTFDLYGLAPPPLSDTGTAPAVPHVPDLLGHADLRIFDFQSVLVQGSQLLPLCLCGVEEGLERGPLFELHFPQLGCEVVFQTPSPARLAPPRPPRDLDTETRKRLITMMAGASVLFSLTKSECTWLWSRRASLKLEPGSLPWLLASAPSWESEALPRIYSLLRDACISPEHALEILHPLFPDKEVRHAAVRSLRQLTDDELMDWLPQLVQALQSEWHIDSCLAHFLLTRATASVRVAHHLYWQLRVSLANGNRRSPVANQAVLAALLSCIGSAQHQALAAQSRLVKILHEAAGNVRHAPQGQPRRDALSASIPSLQDFFSQEGQVRLPLDPEFVARGIDKDGCSYFSSYTVPLRLSFLNAQPGAPNLEFIFKTGDDMRQDALALQLMALMDRLWLRDGLDMHCVSFRCQPTGYRQGLVELVPGAETLRQIQTRHGVTGSFRDSLLSAWLREHNPSARQLQQAEERFIASCAGSCVATYVLGVCDRHNDNVLLCPSGSLFHIDFGRWLGHAQTLGSIRRDRVPFVLTADMAYIINGADHPTSRFDDFVDICCQAYNCLRKHTRLILVHLALMMECGLPELSSSRDLRYVQEALLPGVTEQQAADMFTSLIKASLSSLSTRVNFFIHNLAQLRQPGGGSSRNTAMGNLPTLSFVPSVHSLAADGRVTTVTVVNYEKRYNPEKYYVFVVEVKREGQTGASRVFRSFLEFQELHAKLCMLPAGSFVPRFPTRLIIGRAQTREVAARRATDLHGFLQVLLRCPPAISESDLLYTFLHPLPHDHPRANLDIIQTTPEGFEVVSLGNVAGELSLEICYRNGRLFILILSCRGLVPETGLELAPFVRTLLLPDPHRSTKRKTRSLNHSLNPDFCEMLVYGGYSEEALSRRRLHLSVCSDGSVTILGTTLFPLSDMIFPGPHTFTLTLHTNPLA